jgi:serine protease AprX
VESNGNDRPGYSIFQQGAGLINAYDATHGTGSWTANQGMDVALDLAGEAHYGGLANRTPSGNYYIMGVNGQETRWNHNDTWSSGYLWSDSGVGSSGYLWSDGSVFSNGYLWSDNYSFSSGYLWSDGLSETMSINSWVWQE